MNASVPDGLRHRGQEQWGTAEAPSGYSFILLQIRTPHRGVHPLDLSIGVHPRPSGQSGDADACVGGARPGGRGAPSAESDGTRQEGG